VPLTLSSAAHAAPPRRARAAVAAPAVLLLALSAPLTSLAVLASGPETAHAAAAGAGGEVDVAALAASRSQDVASRSRGPRQVEALAAIDPMEVPAPVAEPAPEPEPEPASAPPVAVRPSDGLMTSPFGPRWGRMHSGVDFATGTGAPVRAAAEGTVASAGAEGGYGLTVRLHHADGAETVYAHLSAIAVEPGQPVGVGHDLGREGSTGQSTGPHLHFEVRYAGSAVDPLTWLVERGVTV
jgi:murein DD-endopeptidase MepM/ murein hydrolase activator NlpD